MHQWPTASAPSHLDVPLTYPCEGRSTKAATILRGLRHAAALDEHATMLDVLAWSQNPVNSRPERILRAHGENKWWPLYSHDVTA